MALREIILNFNSHITEHWKYKVPFYYYKGKPFCYLWQDNKTQQPYIGIVKGQHIRHPELVQGNRKKMKVFMIDPHKDIPIEALYLVFSDALKYY